MTTAPRVTQGSRVFFDASPLRRLAEAELLGPAMAYVPDAVMTDVVAGEIDRAAGLSIPTTDALRGMRRATSWPAVHKTPLDLYDDALIIQAHAGSSGTEDLGEITTVLVAARVGGVVVIAEDKLAKGLCAARRVARVSTATLAIDMHLGHALSEEDAVRLFLLSVPDHVPESAFHQQKVERGRRP